MTSIGRRPVAPASAVRALADNLIRHAPLLTSRVAMLVGVLSLLDLLLHHHGHMLVAPLTPLPRPASAIGEAVVAVSGLLLFRIAAALRRRKRDAWRIAVAICAAMTAGHLVHERRPVEASITLLLLVLLLAARSQFTARADPRSRWFAAQIGAEFLAFAVGYGMVLLYLPGHVLGSPSAWARLEEVLTSLVGAGGWLDIRGDHYADVFHATLFGFGVLIAVCVLVLALRPAEPVATLADCDERRLRDMLALQGARDSLGYFALRRDKSVVWSESGKAAIAYRVVNSVALVSGDPIGDPEAWPGAIAAYRSLVEAFGWTPAVLGCSELGAIVFHREYGLNALALGDEAIVRVADFNLLGRQMRGVRQACARAGRAGYTVEARRVRTIPAAELDELRTAADRWRGDTAERGYSMALSRLGDPSDGDCVVVTARKDGTVFGVLHFVPWGCDGLSLDMMRRDRHSDNGLNELLIVELMRLAPGLGVTRVSLNFAVFREALARGSRIGAGPVLRLWRRMLLLASRWWQIDSLYRFNDKFHPLWEPRFVSFPTLRDAPRITLAALEAEAFIVRPQRLKRLLGRG